MAYVFDHIPFIIATGASISGAIDIEANGILVGILATVWTVSAVISFEAYQPETGTASEAWSTSGATYLPVLNDAGAQPTYPSAFTGVKYLVFGMTAASPSPILAVRYIKVRSGTSAAPVVQTTPGASGYVLVRRSH